MNKELEKKKAEKNLFEEPTEEQFQQEFQEILRKRELYQKEQEEKLREIREENRTIRNKRLYSVAKIAVLVLVAGTCFAVLRVRSEATKMWWLKMTDREIGQESENVVDNDDNRLISDLDEKETISEIESTTGIPIPELMYKPQGMIFDGYEYGNENEWVLMHYLYNDFVVTVKCYNADEDSSYSRNYDGKLLNEQVVDIGYGLINVKEIKSKNDDVSTCIASWNYQNHAYIIEGKLLFDDFLKIIESIWF